MRMVWVSVVVIAVLIMATPLLTTLGQHPPTSLFYYTVAFAMAVCYIIACGSVMFANEHEEGAFGFLESLPIPTWQMTWGKSFFALASSFALLVTLCLIANVWGDYFALYAL